jgi:leucyl/phenylalanyl-tRNA--protein transferase
LIFLPKLSSFDYTFPDPKTAPEDGLLAWGGDLEPKRLIEAYKRGIFPWYNQGDPILWWSPDPRSILFLDEIKISKSLKKSLKKFDIRYDTNFEQVIKMCKESRVKKNEETWISDEMISSYVRLHKMGFAHSVESYFQKRLVGGLYGISIGGVFCGESMFSLMRDASKSALVMLTKRLKEFGYDFIDCQVPSQHLKNMGAVELEREKFLILLKKSLTKSFSIESWN